MVGKSLWLKVVELDRKRNRLILSERLAQRERRRGRKDELLGELKKGDVRKGRISSLAKFGAFVDLGGADGLIHLSELSWSRVNHPSEVIQVGDEVQVYVLNVDRERKRIGLSLRRLEPEGLAGYIAAACRHTAYNAVRDSSRHPWLPLDGEPEVPDERQEVEDRVLRRLELDALAQVWPRLDENTRWLLEARYILDYSDGELARELGVKPDSVRMALTRARRKARRLIENQHSKENV